MGNEVVVQKNIRHMIESDRPRYMQIAPKHINMDRFITSAAIAVYENPKLQECDPLSIRAAIQSAAEVGLDFTKVKGHAYMVPMAKKAVFIAGYRGLIDLAKRNGVVAKIEAHLVRSNDKFSIQYGTDPKMPHIPAMGDRGEIIGAYAIAFFRDGTNQYEFMTLAEMNVIKNRSLAKFSDKSKSPWTTDPDEMYRKTPIRRLFKYLPSNPDFDRAMELDYAGHQQIEGPSTPEAVDPTISLPEPNNNTPEPSDMPTEDSTDKPKRGRRTKSQIEAAAQPPVPVATAPEEPLAFTQLLFPAAAEPAIIKPTETEGVDLW